MKKNKDMNEEELKAQQEETLDNVATSQQDEGDKTEEQRAKEMSVEDKLAAAETKVAELQDKYLRQVAEFDNYRKRTIKEKAEFINSGFFRSGWGKNHHSHTSHIGRHGTCIEEYGQDGRRGCRKRRRGLDIPEIRKNLGRTGGQENRDRKCRFQHGFA